MRRPATIRFGSGPIGPFFPGRKRSMSDDDSTVIPVTETQKVPENMSREPSAAELTSNSEREKPFLYHLKGLIKSILPEANSFFNLFSFRYR